MAEVEAGTFPGYGTLQLGQDLFRGQRVNLSNIHLRQLVKTVAIKLAGCRVGRADLAGEGIDQPLDRAILFKYLSIAFFTLWEKLFRIAPFLHQYREK